MTGQQQDQALWRRRLGGELAVLIALKFAALALIWWLFFSPAHRSAVDAESASQRFGVTEMHAPELPGAASARAQGASGG